MALGFRGANPFRQEVVSCHVDAGLCELIDRVCLIFFWSSSLLAAWCVIGWYFGFGYGAQTRTSTRLAAEVRSE